MSKEMPDYQDADIVLRLYELRREPVMRESRDTMNREFLPLSIDDLRAVTDFSHPMNAAFRQVSSYWEMAFGFARNGIVNAEFLAENLGEGLVLYAKVAPFVEELRASGMPTAFLNAEWLVRNTKAGKARFEAISQRITALKAQKK